MTARINARLDADLARKLADLRRRTGQSTTEILRASLDSYYEKLQREARPVSLLAEFVGCADGPAHLARDYKTELARTLGRKTGSR